MKNMGKTESITIILYGSQTILALCVYALTDSTNGSRVDSNPLLTVGNWMFLGNLWIFIVFILVSSIGAMKARMLARTNRESSSDIVS
jgi:hypothetical protein